jgi:aspartate aminotransferase-like enzyme
MNMTQTLRLKIATEPWEFEQIDKLNYETFVEEIPQHKPDTSGTLVDKFHKENTYVICTDEDNLLGMLAVRDKRPFSLDEKLGNLDSYLPSSRSVCEIRLLAVRKNCRNTTLFRDLIAKAVAHCRELGHNLAVISGTLRQKKLYEHLGFVPFGPVVGTPEASFQPMYLTVETYEKSAKRVIESGPPALTRKKLLLGPGPVEVAPEVRRAFNEPTISHRSAEFLKIHRDTKNLLCRMANAKNVAILMGSGTLANDVIAAQLSLKSGKGLVLSNGEFGDRLINQAKRFSLSFDALAEDWGKSFDYDAIRKTIDRQPGINWLWAVHCETSTGMLNDIAMLKNICNERGISLCLDCVSSLGTVEVDLQGVCYASSVSGKGLRSFPGLSFVFYEQVPLRGDNILPAYLDLSAYHEANGIPFTISSNSVYALYEAIRAGRPTNTAVVSALLKKELRKLGLNTIIPDEQANPAIITIGLARQFDSGKIGNKLDSEGYTISYGSSYLLKRNWIQICLIGNRSRSELMPVLEILGQILAN